MARLHIPKEVEKIFNFVGGKFISGLGPELKVHSPYNGAIIGSYHAATTKDVAEAVRVASQAQQAWGQTPLKERAQVLYAWREILLRDLEMISLGISRECGKLPSESRAGLLKGIEVLEFALSIPNLDLGGKLEVSRGVTCEYKREPLGVVAAITPFNFPAMVPMWMIPIALVLGNAFVWKPSDKTPLTSQKLASTLSEAGLPKGVFTVLLGNAETSQAIISHPEVKALGFVGSTPIARQVAQLAQEFGKRYLALGGAKNHAILLPDADPELAAPGLADSFTGCAGQRCMALSVLLAVGKSDHIINKVVEHAKKIELGKNMGAIISREQQKFLEESIERAQKEGAKILLDGRDFKAPSGFKNGHWLGPTILDNVRPGSHAHATELFGPILSIIRCKNLSEALEIQKSSPFGNAASVFTSSPVMAQKVIDAVDTGMVGVNIGVPVPREPFSFGGLGLSKFGTGDITGESALDLWTKRKKITIKWGNAQDNNWMS